MAEERGSAPYNYERFYELLAECGSSAVADFNQALGPDWAK